jgi:predicted ATPase
LLAARLDSLPPEEKTALQDAAVVGRTFWLGAVQRLSERTPQKTREALSRLRTKEIVLLREPPTFSGEFELAFRHVLIRDVAYDSLPKSLRADKHVQVATWIEKHAGERREEIAELLATHYVQARRYLDELGDTDGRLADVERQAYRWAKAAGERALGLWQQREAVRWFRAALDLGERIGLSRRELAALWESYADASRSVEPYAAVTSAFETALAIYEEFAASWTQGG